VFPAVIAISAAGSDSAGVNSVTSCLVSAFSSSGTHVRQLVLSAGEREPRLRANLDRLQAFLRETAPPTWRWTVIDGTGLGHTETPLATIPPGIRFVHDKSVWQMPVSLADSITSGQVDPERAITSFYAGLSARVGSAVAPSLEWMLAAARIHARRRDSEAEAAARRLIAAYPEDLEGYGILAELATARHDGAAARDALDDARRMLDRLDWHDVYDRERKRKVIENALASIPR